MATQVPSLHIVVGNGGEADLVIDLPGGFDQVLGRDASADITLADPAVSRHHARLYRVADGVWLEDLGSTNGTYINGDRLTVPYRLRDGDEVKLGNSLASFHDLVSSPDATQVLAVPDSLAAAPAVAAADPQPAPPAGVADPPQMGAGAERRVAPVAPAIDTLGVADVVEAGPRPASDVAETGTPVIPVIAATGARNGAPEADAGVRQEVAGHAPAATPYVAPDRTPAATPYAPADPIPAAAGYAAPDPTPAEFGAGHDVARQAPISGPTCPDCSTTNRSEAWFCSQCGRQLRVIPVPGADPGPARPHSRPLMTVHGEFRRQEFHQAMRTRNGGRRVPYNESLALPTIAFRGFLVIVLVALAVFGLVILNEGIHRVFGL